MTKVFNIQIWFKCGMLLLFFLIRTIVCRKNSLYIEKTNFFYGRGGKNYWSTYCTHMACVIRVDEICQCGDVYKKHQ